MEWISVKDRTPDDYDSLYVVMTVYNHAPVRRLNQKPFKIELETWDKADMDLVKYYQDQGDHSWDWASKDHWCNCCLDDTEIAYWLKLPEHPKWI